MNCQETRTVMSAVYPDSRMVEDPAARGAAAHVRSCPECSIWLSSSHAFDRRVAPLFREAAIPEGLRDRLLSALAAAPTATVAQPARSSRRKWLAGSAIAAAALVAVMVFNLNRDPEQPKAFLLSDALRELDHERGSLGALKSFDGNFAPQLPKQWAPWVTGSPLGIDLVAGSEHDAAVYRFQAGQYEGYLVVIAAGRVSDPPSVYIPHESQAAYGPQRVSWTSDDQVCICYLDADGPRLEEFLRELNSQNA